MSLNRLQQKKCFVEIPDISLTLHGKVSLHPKMWWLFFLGLCVVTLQGFVRKWVVRSVFKMFVCTVCGVGEDGDSQEVTYPIVIL